MINDIPLIYDTKRVTSGNTTSTLLKAAIINMFIITIYLKRWLIVMNFLKIHHLNLHLNELYSEQQFIVKLSVLFCFSSVGYCVLFIKPSVS